MKLFCIFWWLNWSSHWILEEMHIAIMSIPYCVSLIMVTITSHIFIDIFQMVHFSGEKVSRGNEKYMSFLWYQNLRKFEQNLKQFDQAPLIYQKFLLLLRGLKEHLLQDYCMKCWDHLEERCNWLTFPGNFIF